MSEDAHEISQIDATFQKPKRQFESANEFLRVLILSFCENLTELGCPIVAEPDMWLRNLSKEDQLAVAQKLNEIIERNP